MSLRNDLIVRLAAVIDPIEGIVGLADYEDACIRALADECLRQMAWARRQIGDRHYDSPDDREYLDEATPMTLAPEDWKP